MSYELYKNHRLAPDDNGCWDVLTNPEYEQVATYPSKASAKRAIDEIETTKSQTDNTELGEILEKYGYFLGLAYEDETGNLHTYKKGRVLEELEAYMGAKLKEAERLGRIDGRRIQAEASADKYIWYTEEGIVTEFDTFLKAQVEAWRYEQAELESARNKDA